MTFNEVRAQYPQYDDMSDEQLASALHGRFYSDMPFDEFAGKIGYSPTPTPDPSLTPDPNTPTFESDGLLGRLNQPDYIDALAAGNVLDATGREAFSRGVSQGATFNFADEVSGAVRGLGNWLMSDSNLTLAEQYRLARDESRQRGAEVAELAPTASTVGEVAGTLSTAPMLPFAQWQRGGSTLANVGTMAGEGALYGALSGLGASEGSTLSEIAGDTVTGGGMGALVGGALGSGGAALGKISDTFSKPSLLNFFEGTKGGQTALRKQADELQSKADDLLKSLAPDNMRSADQVGRAYREAFESFDDMNRKAFNDAYEEIYKRVDMTTNVTPQNSLDFLRNELDQFGDNAALARLTESKLVSDLRNAMDGDISIDALKSLRSRVGEATKSGKIGDVDIDTNVARRLYGALSDDLDSAIIANADAPTAQAFRELSGAYKQVRDETDALALLMGSRGGTPKTDTQIGVDLGKLYSNDPSRLEVLRLLDAGDSAGAGIINQMINNQGSTDAARAVIRDNISNLRYSGAGDVVQDLAGAGTVRQLDNALNLERQAQAIRDNLQAGDTPLFSLPFGGMLDRVNERIVSSGRLQSDAIPMMLQQPIGNLTRGELRYLLEVLSAQPDN